MRRTQFGRLLFALALIWLTYNTSAHADDAPDRCGGVLMATKSPGSKHMKDLVQMNGFYAADGGLVDKDGKSTCTSIRIECFRQTNTCRTATATTTGSVGHPQILGVFMSDDYTVSMWTKDEISAEMRPPLGGTSQLHIALSDKGPDKITIVNILKSLIAHPGEWQTEVLTVENDPVIEAILKKAKGE